MHGFPSTLSMHDIPHHARDEYFTLGNNLKGTIFPMSMFTLINLFYLEGQKKHLLATSEPAPTSLTPRHATLSPIMDGSRKSLFSSGDPNLQQKMSLGPIIAAITDIRESNSFSSLLNLHICI